jgi:hypothetical protein
MATPLTVPRSPPAIEPPEGPAANIYPEGEHTRAVWRLEKFGAVIDNAMIGILLPFHERQWPLSTMARLTGLEEETIRCLLEDAVERMKAPDPSDISGNIPKSRDEGEGQHCR